MNQCCNALGDEQNKGILWGKYSAYRYKTCHKPSSILWLFLINVIGRIIAFESLLVCNEDVIYGHTINLMIMNDANHLYC